MPLSEGVFGNTMNNSPDQILMDRTHLVRVGPD